MPHAFDHNAFDLSAFDVDSVSATATITGVSVTIAAGTITALATAGSGGGKKPVRFVRPKFSYGPAAMHARAFITGVTIKVGVGNCRARGIQNPTDEELLVLLEALACF